MPWSRRPHGLSAERSELRVQRGVVSDFGKTVTGLAGTGFGPHRIANSRRRCPLRYVEGRTTQLSRCDESAPHEYLKWRGDSKPAYGQEQIQARLASATERVREP